ncbi:MAG: hypothetical protein Gaeavirus6_1, partial [Gaeavirus sp.]
MSSESIYDKTTTEYYGLMRKNKIDPIMHDEIPEDLIFEFKDKWNPLTGQRESTDASGPLCFNALNLYEYYFINRLNGLWTSSTSEYEGFYGDSIGRGQDIKINAVVSCPERYLYRLPIIDCYLKKNHNHSIITMGPKLLDDEIALIDELVSNHVGSDRPTLKVLKELYDSALDSEPDLSKLISENP